MEGSEAIARGRDRRRLPLLRRLPDDAVHRAARALRHACCPRSGGVCINAESELEAVGMAWGALATGARAATGSTGQGLSLMQESFSRDHAGRAAARRLQHGARPAGLLPGDPGRRPRRLPPHRARAAWTSPRRVELTQLAFHLADKWRNPVLVYGDYLLAHTQRGGDGRAASSSPRCPPKDWAVDGSLAGTGRVAHRHAARLRQARPTRARASSGTCAHIAAKLADDRSDRGAGRDRLTSTTPRPWSSRSARRRKFVRYVVEPAARRGREDRLRAPDHAVAVPVRRGAPTRPAARAPSPSFELCAGQMIDDVRIGVAGRAPVVVHRRRSRPTARASASGRCSTSRSSASGSSRCTGAAPSAELPPLPDQRTRATG